MSNFAGKFLSIRLAKNLQNDYRIVTLSIPPNADYNKRDRWALCYSEKENVDKIDAYGHSMGACHIQGLIQRYPEVVDKVIYSHSTNVRSLNDINRLNVGDLKAANLMIKLLLIMPLFIIKKVMGNKFKKHLILSTPEATKELNTQCEEYSKVIRSFLL